MMDRESMFGDQMSIIGAQMRKARWYSYMCRRFNLVSFEDIADWCARDAGGVRRCEATREQALRDLENSIVLGEFGPPDRRLIPCFPKPPPVGEPRQAVKLSAGQILWMRDGGQSVTKYLHITADQARAWLSARNIALPPWLQSRPAPAPADERMASRLPDATSDRPATKQPFNRDDARRLLLSRKVMAGPWEKRPTRREVRDFLQKHYIDVPRDPVDCLMTELWGAGKTGPRSRRTR